MMFFRGAEKSGEDAGAEGARLRAADVARGLKASTAGAPGSADSPAAPTSSTTPRETPAPRNTPARNDRSAATGPVAAGKRGGRLGWWLLGPALVAGVAYLDPGNVASNMTAGARFGYLLVWVVVLGNLMAWLIQYLSAKLGVVTGESLPELVGKNMKNRRLRRAYWVQAQLVAMATDVAEVIGGAVALWLLFDVPLVLGGLITAVISLLMLVVQSRHGARSFEAVIIAMLAIVAVGFTVGAVVGPPDPAATVGGLLPRFEGTDSVLLAASILGATIMPHAIYAHSALSRDRFRGRDAHLAPQQVRRVLRATKWDVTIALAIAGSVNLAILLVAAANLAGVPGTDSLEGAYAALATGLGTVVATLFAVGLLASGLASSAVGAYAGAEITSGLLTVRIPLFWRRVMTAAPALIILAIGFDPTTALVLSQVVLSFGIPFALVPLVWFTAKRSVVGSYRNRWWTTALGIAASAFLITLNVMLLVLTATGT